MFAFAKNDSITLFIFDIENLKYLDERQLKLLLVLAAKADSNQDYACNPTQEELSNILGWSRPTVQSVINSLLEIKIAGKQILQAQKLIKQGGGYHTLYKINCFQ